MSDFAIVIQNKLNNYIYTHEVNYTYYINIGLFQILTTLAVLGMKRITYNRSSLDQDSSIETSSLALLFL